jgi:Amt family ammonium transporter
MGEQLIIQITAVLVAIVWAAVGTAIVAFIVKAVTGLRVTGDVEREGLDIGEHGERAYNH